MPPTGAGTGAGVGLGVGLGVGAGAGASVAGMVADALSTLAEPITDSTPVAFAAVARLIARRPVSTTVVSSESITLAATDALEAE